MSGIVASLLSELVAAPVVAPRGAEAGPAAGEGFAGALVQAMAPPVPAPVAGETAAVPAMNDAEVAGNGVVAAVHDVVPPVHDVVPASSGVVGVVNDIEGSANDVGGVEKGVASSMKRVAAPMHDVVTPMNDVVTPMNDVVTPMNDVAAPVNDVAAPVRGVAGTVKDVAGTMKDVRRSRHDVIARSMDVLPAGNGVVPAGNGVAAPGSEAITVERPDAARAHHVQVKAETRANPAESSAPDVPDPVKVADVAAPAAGREQGAAGIAEPARRGWADEDAYETAAVVRDPVAGAVQLLFAALAPAVTKSEAPPAATQAPPAQPSQVSPPRIRVAGRSTGPVPDSAGEPGVLEEAGGPESASDETLDADAPIAAATEGVRARVAAEGDRPAPRAVPAATTRTDRLAELAGGAERVEVVLARRAPEPAPRPAPRADAAPEREPAPALDSAAAAAMPEGPIGTMPSGRADSGLTAAGPGTVSGTEGTAPMRAPDLEPLQAPRAFDQVTVQLGEELGGGSLRVAVRNGVVRARIVSGDEQVARSLEHGLGELQSTLAQQGFSDTRVSVQGAPSTRSVEGAAAPWAAAAAGHAAESGAHQGGAQGDTRQERSDGQARREGEDAPRQERHDRQERHERHERQQRARNGWRAWLDGND